MRICSLCNKESHCIQLSSGIWICPTCKVIKDAVTQSISDDQEQQHPRYLLFRCKHCNDELVFPVNPAWEFQFIGLVQARHKCGRVLTIGYYPGIWTQKKG